MKVKQKKSEMEKKACSVRIRRFAGLLKKNGIDAAIIRSAVNLFYFTGMQTSNGLLMVYAEGFSVFLTDFRYYEAAERGLPEKTELELLKTGAAKSKQLTKLFAGLGFIGCEDNLALNEFEQFNEAAGQGVDWTPVSDLISGLRAVKSRDELKMVRQAAQMNDAVFLDVLNAGLHGRKESEIQRLIKIKMIAEGGEEAFDAIVAAGANASQCHHIAADDVCGQKGTSLLIDMGVKFGQYCSDMTRCISFGKPSAAYRRVYDLVLKANESAIDQIVPGRTCAEIDEVARKIISTSGYGKNFGHSLGHAVGLEIHESPAFRAGDVTVLQPGMILTVEPGVYLPGRFGIRIEDLVLVTRTGCEVLTQTPKELLIV